MKIQFALLVLLWAACSTAWAGSDSDGIPILNPAEPVNRDMGPSWSAHSGSVRIRFNQGLLRDLGLSVSAGPGTRTDAQDWLLMQIQDTDVLEFKVRAGESVEQLSAGRWVTRSGLQFQFGAERIDFGRLMLQPSPKGGHVLELRNPAGELLLFADHMHSMVDLPKERILMRNMDLRLAPAFAHRIGEPRHIALAIGQMEIESQVFVPPGAQLGPEFGEGEGSASCAGRPKWPGVDGAIADVRLTALGSVQQTARNASEGLVVITPSATLKNRSGANTADIPWYQQFTGSRPPYGNDQHPFLVWGLFRVSEGRIEQIGRSGVKHAFFTVNQNCEVNCGMGGSVLWPGCEDTYGVGNNNDPQFMGPIDEIRAFAGTWDSCGSFFDANCDGSQEGFSGGGFLNRMVVRETDLQVAGAQYFFQGWYVVREDVNILNTMGYRPLNPQFAGSSWSFSPAGFTQGPAIDAYISVTNQDGDRRNTPVTTAVGQLRVTVNVLPLENQRWRYEYALMNLDLDAGVSSFEISVPGGVEISSPAFRAASGTDVADWLIERQGNVLRFTAPDANADRQPWMSLFNFSFIADTAPVAGSLSFVIPSTDAAAEGDTRPGIGSSAQSLVPEGNERIFFNSFEVFP